MFLYFVIQCVKGRKEDMDMRKSWGEGKHDRKHDRMCIQFTKIKIKIKIKKKKKMPLSLTTNQNYSSVCIW